MFHIRPLTVNDLEAADQVVMSAYQTTSRRIELERLMCLARTTWLAGEEEGKLVGMVGAIDYGSFAYIGMMGVHAEFQRRGYGKSLMLALIECLEQAGQPCTLLDASEAGAPLYAQIGYIDLSLAQVFKRNSEMDFPSPAAQVEALGMAHLPELAAFDRPIFGADRSHVLRFYLADYPRGSFGVRSEQGMLQGFVVAQNKRIGPWAAMTQEAAAALLQAVLKLDFKDTPEVILPSPNQAGLELLQSAGFVRKRWLRHMGRGCTGLSRHLESIFGQCSFMLG